MCSLYNCKCIIAYYFAIENNSDLKSLKAKIYKGSQYEKNKKLSKWQPYFVVMVTLNGVNQCHHHKKWSISLSEIGKDRSLTDRYKVT